MTRACTLLIWALAQPATAASLVILGIEYSNDDQTLIRGESLTIAFSTGSGPLPADARVTLLDANTGALVDEKQLSTYSDAIDLEVPDFMELGFVEYRVNGELMLRIPEDRRSYLEFSEAAASGTVTVTSGSLSSLVKTTSPGLKPLYCVSALIIAASSIV